MDPRELEALAKRLGENANDTEALNAAYAHGQQDPRGYAVFLEKAAGYSQDPALGAHWFCEAANVWTASLGDVHRAERALVRAVDTDPLHPTAVERLVQMHAEKGNSKGIAALHQRRAKTLEKLLAVEPALGPQLAAIYAELARVFNDELAMPERAIDAYRKAAEYNPQDAYSIYQARELLKAAGRYKEALPYFEAEQRLIQGDAERQAQLYADEAEVCRKAGETEGLLRALRGARSVDPHDDPGLKQQLGAAVLELVQAGKKRPQEDIDEAVAMFVSLAETYDGEHGHSYSLCALGLEPGNDRAAQLAMYYGEQIGKWAETAHPAAQYLAANPQGAVADDARALVARVLSSGGGDETLILALTPAENAPPEVKAGSYGVLARAMVGQGREKEALAYYARLLEASPADEEAVFYVADRLRGKKPKDLRALLLRAAQAGNAALDQRHAWLSEVAELCEGPLGDVAGAIEARRQLVLMDPSDEEAADHLEETLQKAQQWDDLAELILRRAEVDIDLQSQLERHLRVSKIYREKLNKFEEAGDALARAVRIEPGNQELTFEAVDLLIQAGRSEKASVLLQSLLGEVLAGDARANYSERLAEILEGSGHFVEAGGAYAEAASQASDAALWAKAQTCFEKASAWEQAARATSERRALTEAVGEKAALCAAEADYLVQLGDGEGAIVCLKEALELEPSNDAVASRLEAAYTEQDRFGELASLLLVRARAIKNPGERTALRKRAAFLQRDSLNDDEGMRDALLEALEDGDDPEILRLLADDAESQGHRTLTVEYLQRLAGALGDEGRAEVALRLAKLLEEEDDEEGALEQYLIALQLDPKNVEVLSAVAHLQRATGDNESSADSYKRLLPLTQGEQKLGAARCLADILAELDRPEEAIAAYKVVLDLDQEDLEAVEKLRDLAESAEIWEDYAKYHAQLVEMEGDEGEAAKMGLRLAEVLHQKLDRPEEALRALVPFAKNGDGPCREEYERLGDSLGKQEQVAESLVAWCSDAPAGPSRNKALRRAYDRFIEVKRGERALEVGLELVRMKGASEELAKSIEEIAIPLKNIEGIQSAFVVLGRDISGPPRAEEMVRQAEVLARAGMPSAEAIQHGEQALTSIAPSDAETLLARLSALTEDNEEAISVYERQVTRCKSPDERISALCRAAEVAAERGEEERVAQFFEIALQAAGQAEGLDDLRSRVKASDESSGKDVLRNALCSVLSEAGKGARDGGRSRGAYLARAAKVAYEDLEDTDRAFRLIGDALVAHTDEESLDQLVQMGELEDSLARVVEVLGNTLEQVHDGPLVRLLLRQRFELRSKRLGDEEGAGEDLKKLYDLSPSDGDIANELEERYKAAGDDRGLVQLYEDQILRGRDQAARAELARKVALLWQDVLKEPREAADAWRRVLRMNSGDAEAKEGLERAKQGMRKVSVRQVVEAEAKTRQEVEARQAEEEAEARRREEELKLKAEELRARHSNPPPPLEDEETGGAEKSETDETGPAAAEQSRSDEESSRSTPVSTDDSLSADDSASMDAPVFPPGAEEEEGSSADASIDSEDKVDPEDKSAGDEEAPEQEGRAPVDFKDEDTRDEDSREESETAQSETAEEVSPDSESSSDEPPAPPGPTPTAETESEAEDKDDEEKPSTEGDLTEDKVSDDETASSEGEASESDVDDDEKPSPEDDIAEEDNEDADYEVEDVGEDVEEDSEEEDDEEVAAAASPPGQSQPGAGSVPPPLPPSAGGSVRPPPPSRSLPPPLPAGRSSVPPPLPAGGRALPAPSSASGLVPPPPPGGSRAPLPPPPASRIPPPPPGVKRPPGLPPPPEVSAKPNIPPPPGRKPPPPPLSRK